MVQLEVQPFGVGYHYRRLTKRAQRDFMEALHVMVTLMEHDKKAPFDAGHDALDFCEWCALRERMARLNGGGT